MPETVEFKPKGFTPNKHADCGPGLNGRDGRGHYLEGNSGNPGGRVVRSDRNLARNYTEMAVETLRDCMGPKFPGNVRVSAAIAMLNRGWGLPKIDVEASSGLSEIIRAISASITDAA